VTGNIQRTSQGNKDSRPSTDVIKKESEGEDVDVPVLRFDFSYILDTHQRTGGKNRMIYITIYSTQSRTSA